MTNYSPLPTLLLTCLSASFLAVSSGAQDLLLDINLDAPGNPSSAITALTSIGDHALFSASDSATGAELWTSDGTAAGTQQLADIFPGSAGSNPSNLVTLPNGLTVFAANSALGRELHVTDGTPSFTRLLVDLFPGSTSGFVAGPVLFGTEAFFYANSPAAGIELWRTDGTQAGTVLAHEFFPGPIGAMSATFPGWLATSDSQLFAFAKNPTGSGWGLYAGDPANTGMSFVAEITATGFDQIRGFVHLGDQIFFGAPSPTMGDELWISDGTAAGTFMVDLDTASESLPDDFHVMDGYVYFAANHSQIGRELVRTDGTIAGTELVRDIEPSQSLFFASSSPDLLGVADGRLMLNATTLNTGRRLWATDGTFAGTVPVSGAIGFDFADKDGVVFGDELVFTVSVGADDLWITDGTAAGTRQATDITPNSSNSFVGLPVVVAGQLLFGADEGVHGQELWVSNGTPAGTSFVLDIAEPFTNFGSDPRGFTEVGDHVYFVAGRNDEPDQIWKTDGTAVGTTQVTDYDSVDAASIQLGVEFDGRLFFMGNDSVNGLEPWMSDGTAAGTALLADIFPGVGASNWGMPDTVIIGDKLFFTALGMGNGFELYVTDGTPQGTQLAPNITLPSNFGFLGELFAAGDVLYFAALDANADVTTYRYDTITETFSNLGDFNPAGDDTFFGSGVAEVSAGVLFSGNDGVNGFELWIDDGGLSGPAMLLDLAPGAESSLPHTFTSLGDIVLFTTGAQFGASSLWATDGTVNGTTELVSNDSGLRSEWAVCRDLAFIWAVDVVGQDTLFVTDGTVAGTQALLSTTFQSSFSTAMTPLGSGNLVAFQNYSPVTGIETWTSDGTVAGTQLFSDGWVGNNSVQPRGFSRAGDTIVLGGYLNGTGREPLRFDLFDLGGYVAETYGEGCVGSNGTAPSIGVTDEPSVSDPFAVTIVGAAQASTGFAYYSSSKVSLLLAGGCMVHVDLGIPPITFATDSLGSGSIPVNLDASFAGRQLFVQAFVLDVGAQIFGIASATPGLEIVVGP